jgi:hypothetical protein
VGFRYDTQDFCKWSSEMTETAKEKPGRDRTYSITELCREFEVTPRTLRFYEQKGLLAPNRRGWTRLFTYRDRARLQLILGARRSVSRSKKSKKCSFSII